MLHAGGSLDDLPQRLHRRARSFQLEVEICAATDAGALRNGLSVLCACVGNYLHAQGMRIATAVNLVGQWTLAASNGVVAKKPYPLFLRSLSRFACGRSRWDGASM